MIKILSMIAITFLVSGCAISSHRTAKMEKPVSAVLSNKPHKNDRQNVRQIPQVSSGVKKRVSRAGAGTDVQLDYRPQTKKLILHRKGDVAASEKRSRELEFYREEIARLKALLDRQEWKAFEKAMRDLEIQVSRLDNVGLEAQLYFLKGLAAYQMKDYAKSLKAFDKIVKNTKIGAEDQARALFAKARVYHVMNIPEQSRKIYEQILKDYPNTLEAKRAQIELRRAHRE
ncbi:MAG: tetratricopeptide repeat protein [Bdellovibrionaceae bacterium]|nr:tetratricopeptide repeat protein [Pseudobdellovibrionaceae bacterium]MDW8190236.1 tetratricopeptide repeat protein [Pseudobdellovibrionaceae bacterium]